MEFVMSVQACGSCNTPNTALEKKLSACSRCKKVFYCSTECQKNHWTVHKPLCGRATIATRGAAEWETVILAQQVIDKILEDTIQKRIEGFQQKECPEPLIPILYAKSKAAVLDIASSLIEGVSKQPEDKGAENDFIQFMPRQLQARFYRFIQTIDEVLKTEPVRKKIAEDLQTALADAKKSIVFDLESKKIAYQASNHLKAFVDSHRSKQDLQDYLKNELLPSLANERSRIAHLHQDPEAPDFGKLRDRQLNEAFITPLDRHYQTYNQRMAELFDRNDEATGQYTEWTPLQMKQQGFVEFSRKTKADVFRHLFGSESTTDATLKKSQGSFSERERNLIVTSKLKDLKRAQEFIDAFPEAYEIMQTSLACMWIAENQKTRTPHLNKIDAFEIKTDPFGLVPCIGSSPRNIARLTLDDPSNHSIFWMVIPHGHEPQIIYLQHSNIVQSEEMMNTVIELSAKIIQLDPKADADFKELKQLIAEVVFAFAQATPYKRGSASIGEWLESILYQHHGVTFTHLPSADCQALTLSKHEFLDLYMRSVKISHVAPAQAIAHLTHTYDDQQPASYPSSAYDRGSSSNQVYLTYALALGVLGIGLWMNNR